MIKFRRYTLAIGMAAASFTLPASAQSHSNWDFQDCFYQPNVRTIVDTYQITQELGAQRFQLRAVKASYADPCTGELTKVIPEFFVEPLWEVQSQTNENYYYMLVMAYTDESGLPRHAKSIVTSPRIFQGSGSINVYPNDAKLTNKALDRGETVILELAEGLGYRQDKVVARFQIQEK